MLLSPPELGVSVNLEIRKIILTFVTGAVKNRVEVWFA